MAPTWYLGPAGQLQALSCPETNIQMSKVRYGGVHRSISGAATVDVTGHKAEYQLAWNWVEESEVRALEAMHDRIVPGPFWLIDPTRRNRLSTQATKLHYLALTYPGVRVSGGGLDYVKEWPTDAGLGTRCLRWTDQPASDHQLVFDYGKWVPVIPGETLTGSVYVKGGGSLTVRMAWTDSAGVDLGTDASSSYTATSSWTRYTVSGTVPTGAALVRFEIARGSSAVDDIDIAAPQLEVGSQATDFQTGGGASLVHIDQLERTSPLYPYYNVSMTLLEA